MTAGERQFRAQIAIQTLARTRAGLRDIVMANRQQLQVVHPDTFPRSRTFRWALTHPFSRLLGSGALGGTVTRLLLAKFVGSLVFGRKK